MWTAIKIMLATVVFLSACAETEILGVQIKERTRVPNPTSVVLDFPMKAKVWRNGTWTQRVVLTQGTEEVILSASCVICQKEAILKRGIWEIKYEFQWPGLAEWELGKIEKRDRFFYGFDDGPEGVGDHDFNDTQLIFRFLN